MIRSAMFLVFAIGPTATAFAQQGDTGRIIPFDPVPLPEVRIPVEHPRVWFTGKDVPELRKRCQSTHQAQLKQLVDLSGVARDRSGIQAFNLAFLYQMTGEAKYARQAIALAREVRSFDWVQPNEKKLPYGEWYAGLSDPLACVFDWCYDQLSAEERKAIGGVLREELAHGPYVTRFHECWWMPAWLSEILAIYGAGIDDQLAEKALADYNRSIHQFVSLADEIHADGAMGDYLYQYRNMMTWPEMWLRATGENLFVKSGFYRTTPEYLLYSVLPAGHWLANDGDGPQDALGGLGYSFAPDAATFRYYAFRNNNPYARWFAAHMRGWPHAGDWDRPWQAILWADERREEKPLGNLTPVRFFAENGVAIMRSGWNLSAESTDTVAAFYCRPAESHTHLNVGHFTIWRGVDQLAGRAGYYWGTQNEYHHNFFTRTVAHNCLLISDPQEPPQTYSRMTTSNDGGQVRGDPTHYALSHKLLMGNNPYFYRGRLQTMADEPTFTYLFADLTPAYSATKARRVVRAFLWLKPSTFVICDWVKAAQAEFPKRWLLHMANRPTLDGAEKIVAGTIEAGILESSDSRRAVIERDSSKLVLQTLLPERLLTRRVGGRGYAYYSDGKNWDISAQDQQRMSQRNKDQAEAALASLNHWRIEIEPAEPATDCVFLNVLDLGAKEDPAPAPAAVVQRDQAVGAALLRGGRKMEVLCYSDGRATVDGKMVGKSLEPLKPYTTAPK